MSASFTLSTHLRAPLSNPKNLGFTVIFRVKSLKKADSLKNNQRKL
jgi:hypothetical protein